MHEICDPSSAPNGRLLKIWGRSSQKNRFYVSKVTGQNVKFVVTAPPSGQTAPNLTLHSLGSSAIHPPSVKLIGWMVVQIIKGPTERQILLPFIVRSSKIIRILFHTSASQFSIYPNKVLSEELLSLFSHDASHCWCWTTHFFFCLSRNVRHITYWVRHVFPGKKLPDTMYALSSAL